jgi:hypothetical protein
MQVPPPNLATTVLAQKLIGAPPSSFEGKVQHWLYAVSVQSDAAVQSRTRFDPVHELWKVVGQALAAVHAVVAGSDVQLGTDPPVLVIVAQQTCAEAQSETFAQAGPASTGAEESPPPLLLPLLLPAPLLLPVPLLLPLPLPLPLPPPASGVTVELLLLQARNPTKSDAVIVIESGTERAFIGRFSSTLGVSQSIRKPANCNCSS